MVKKSKKNKSEGLWEQLLAQKPSNDDLLYIIEYCEQVWKDKAWEQLLAQKPSNDDLRYIIRYCEQVWKDKAKALLQPKQSTKEQIIEQMKGEA